MKILIQKNEVRTLFNLPHTCEVELEDESLAQAVLHTTVSSAIGREEKTITVTFPELTAKEITASVDNKIENGVLLYGDWYKNEDFYTTEKTRPGIRVVNLELLHTEKSWNETKEIVGIENMLNFAETVYLLKENKEFRDILRYKSDKDAWWTWTSSRASDGRLVYVGRLDGDGALVGRGSFRTFGTTIWASH